MRKRDDACSPQALVAAYLMDTVSKLPECEGATVSAYASDATASVAVMWAGDEDDDEEEGRL